MDISSAKVLCIGAHPDDIAIGCGGTLLEQRPQLTWVCLTGTHTRALEELATAKSFGDWVTLMAFRDGYLHYDSEVKDFFETLKCHNPEIIFCPRLKDAHQDHRTVAELTYQTFRTSTILEYEIPKYDGDISRPNIYIPIERKTIMQKIKLIADGYPSQHERNWFCPETFSGLAKLRGVEANTDYAEAFYCRKLVL